MKRLLTLLLTAVLLCAWFPSRADESVVAFACPAVEEPETLPGLEKRIEQIGAELQRSRLRYNRALWESYLDIQKNSEHAIPIFAIKTFDAEALYDSVPRLRSLNKDFEKARDEIVRKNYHADATPTKVQSPKWQKKRDVAYRVYNRTLKAQNLAIARHLLDYYNGRGQLMPTAEAVDKEMSTLRQMNPGIESFEWEIQLLREKLDYLNRRKVYLGYGE